MGREVDLLKMLEPIVRPDGVGGAKPTLRQGRDTEPIEKRSFESLLEQARQMNEAEIEEDQKKTQGSDEKARQNQLGLLAGLDRIENGSLRQLMSRAAVENGGKGRV